MKYTKTTNQNGIVSILREEEDGKVWVIPEDAGNSDYQAYLESLEPKAKAPKVVDEAPTDAPA